MSVQDLALSHYSNKPLGTLAILATAERAVAR